MKYCATCKTVYPADFQCCPKDGSALNSSSELLPGMVIRDKYEILRQIGSGGMATVYQVRHLAFNEIRAIKLINSQLAEGDQFNKRLRSEAVIARRLQHPNAVHVDDLDRTEDGRPFIVMEYVEGQNLRTIIRQNGPLPVLRALRIASQVASALSEAHKLGIIHRDIKPDNINLISQPDGTDFVKVLDFGIAKFTHDLSSSAPRTGSGLVVGTPQYVSPEQAMGKQTGEIDGRSDLYTLGVVVYEMLTGQVPFDSDTPVGWLVHHLNTAPVPPDELRPDLGIPNSVSELLMKALQKNPAQRFADAEEMLQAINQVEQELTQAQETGTAFQGTQEKSPEPLPVSADVPRAAPTPVEFVRPVSEARTPVPSAEIGLGAIKPSVTDKIPSSAYDAPRPDTAGFREASRAPADASFSGKSVDEPVPPAQTDSPPQSSEVSSDPREELLAAAYGAPSSRGRLYGGIAAVAVVCLAAIGIYQWRSASAKAPELSPPQVQDQNVPGAATSARPANETARTASASPAQHSEAVPHPAASGNATSPNPPARSEDLRKQQSAQVKDLVSQGRALSDRGEYTAAIEVFDSALKLDPKSSEARNGKRQAEERLQLEQALPNEAK